MLNTASWDPLHTSNYVGGYLDLVESLPLDLQRNVSLMREMDSKYQELLKDLDEAYEKYSLEEDPIHQRPLLHFIQSALIRTQELGDEKIQHASQMVEMVENCIRQVDNLAELLEAVHEPFESVTANTTSSIISCKKREEKQIEESFVSIDRLSGASKRSRRQRNNNETLEYIATVHHDEVINDGIAREKRNKTSKKRKRSKAKSDREPSPTDLRIDPNEPTYCLCEQVSFGQMIGCDNDECPIEWFHFSCVGLNHKPKGKWYCPQCRGETEKTMDKALDKAKKERAYNT